LCSASAARSSASAGALSAAAAATAAATMAAAAGGIDVLLVCVSSAGCWGAGFFERED
jgi:putative protein kinase ArgK-like GTPase of G3E family